VARWPRCISRRPPERRELGGRRGPGSPKSPSPATPESTPFFIRANRLNGWNPAASGVAYLDPTRKLVLVTALGAESFGPGRAYLRGTPPSRAPRRSGAGLPGAPQPARGGNRAPATSRGIPIIHLIGRSSYHLLRGLMTGPILLLDRFRGCRRSALGWEPALVLRENDRRPERGGRHGGAGGTRRREDSGHRGMAPPGPGRYKGGPAYHNPYGDGHASGQDTGGRAGLLDPARGLRRPHSTAKPPSIDSDGPAAGRQIRGATTRTWLGIWPATALYKAVKESSYAGGTACAPQQVLIFRGGAGGSACLARLRAFFSHLLAFAARAVRRCVSIGARPRRYFLLRRLALDDSQVRQHLRIGFVHRQQVVAGVCNPA